MNMRSAAPLRYHRAGQATPRFALLRRRHAVPLWSAIALAVLIPPVLAVEVAPVPVTGRFDLRTVSRPLLVGKWLHDRRHIPQSFAFDDAAGFVYVLQVEGANSAGTFRDHAARGDLILTKLSRDGDTIAGHMTLRGFGHGVAFGVEPAGDGTVHLWTEVDSQPNDAGVGRGTRLARFAFEDGGVLGAGSPSLQKFDLQPGTRVCTPSLDLVHGRLAMRYTTAGVSRVALYDLAAVKEGCATRVRDIAFSFPFGVLQGWCTFGSYLYVLAGEPYSASNAPPGNATLWCIDWNTGAVVERRPSTVFSELEYREPEGLAVRIVDGAPQLCLGFGSAVSATDSRRQFNVAVHSGFLPVPTSPP
jgi:hypothetical protein